MVSKTGQLPPTQIKHKGIFSLSVLLKSIRIWFAENDYSYHETKYKAKNTQTGNDLELEIFGERKINEYVNYNIKVYLRIFDMKEVEVVKNGEKLKMNDGRVYAEISGIYELDWQNRFSGNKFLIFLEGIFRKFVIKYNISDWWEDNLFFKYQALIHTIKSVLEFEDTK